MGKPPELKVVIRGGGEVSKCSKLIEVAPVNDKSICNFIADKMRAIGKGVLEAITLKYG